MPILWEKCNGQERTLNTHDISISYENTPVEKRWSWFQCQITFTLPDNTGEKMRRNENGNSGTLTSPDN